MKKQLFYQQKLVLKFHFASSAIFDHLYSGIYCHTIQTSISLYKRYKIFNGEKNITRYNLSFYFYFS